LRTTDGGYHWNELVFPNTSDAFHRTEWTNIRFFDHSFGFLFSPEKILFTTNSGATWYAPLWPESLMLLNGQFSKRRAVFTGINATVTFGDYQEY
jgi:photosystem II stability/assembly factor-like uncharacterized protein